MTTPQSLPCLLPLALAFLLSFSQGLRAQATPDAGSLLQQIEKAPAQRQPEGQRPRTAAPPQELGNLGAGASVTVRGFAFSGHRLLDEATLARVVAPWVGRTVDLNELRRAATAVAEAYRERGWVVRAFLPPQDVTEGRIRIQVLEAVFGGVRLDGGTATRVPAQRAQQIIERQQTPGAPLSAPALDAGLLLADDLAGLSVAGVLVPGATEGQTALALRLADEPLLSGVLSLDNSGSRATGEQRAAAQLNLNSPLGRGEQFSGLLMHTRGSRYVRLAAGLPLGLEGLRAGLNVSRFDYRLIRSDFSALGAEGSAETLGLDASRPLLRSRLANVYVLGTLDHKRLHNRAGGRTSSHYTIDIASLGLAANLFDDWGGGGGASSASLSLATGRLDLARNPGPRIDGSGGRFTRVRYAGARQQNIGRGFTLYAAFSGQWADKNLDSAERFALGGPGGVRAYPGNEGSGTSGRLLTLEARQRVAPALSLIAFFDQGWVRQYRRNDDGDGRPLSGPAPNHHRLAGHGLGLAWNGPRGLGANLHWAARQGRHPNPGPAGLDQDGSRPRDRVWLGLSLPI